MKCKVCKRYFVLSKDDRYEVVKTPAGLQVFTEEAKIYECFDCPKCGCQNIVNVREGTADLREVTIDEARRSD